MSIHVQTLHLDMIQVLSVKLTQRLILYCLCRSPWIQGTTSKAIYGGNQKSFNSHVCCRCQNWFHIYCLQACGITPPKRQHDFVCPECATPPTISWNHNKYTNTCTSDNILTVILLHSQQYANFLEKMGSSSAEIALKASIKIMLQGNLTRGKTIMLDYVNSVLTLPYNGKKYDCMGSEYTMFLQLFTHVWKQSISLTCNSPFCPKPKSERHPSSYSLQPHGEIMAQIQEQFPIRGDSQGYCGIEFPKPPPSQAPQAINDRLNVDSHERVEFYECRGMPIVQSAAFLTSKPWIIPFVISSFKALHMGKAFLTFLARFPLCLLR